MQKKVTKNHEKLGSKMKMTFSSMMTLKYIFINFMKIRSHESCFVGILKKNC